MLSCRACWFERIRRKSIVNRVVFSAILLLYIWSVAAAQEAIPIPASGLTALALSSSQVQLTWADNSDNETEFKVELSEDSVSFTPLTSAAADSTSYAVTNLNPLTTYYFRISASNAAGDSDYSNTASVTTAGAPTVPIAPASLTATANSSSEIELTWQDLSSNEEGFQIERGTDGVTFAQLATLPPDANSHSDSQLLAATTYFYRVRAYNADGNSDYSNSAQATTANPTPTPPAKPEQLSAKVPRSPVRLAWYYKPPSDNNAVILVRNFHFFVLTKTDEPFRDELKAKGGQGPFLQYLLSNEIQDPGSCTTQPFRNQVADQIGDFCWINSEHPDWFLLDTNGNRISYLNGTKRNYQMDPGNPGWRAFFLERARISQEQLGWDGVFMDNVDASIRRFTRQGQTPAKYPNEAAYRTAMEAFLRDLYTTYFKPQNRPLYGNITEVNSTAAWFQYIQYLDGAMNESFAVDWDPGYKSVASWEENLKRAEDTEQMGKTSVLIGQGEQTNLARQRFAFASYLLVAGTKNVFRYSKVKMNTYWWLYPNYEFDLGEPMGPRYQQNGVWWRDFTKGKVWVDPAAHTSDIIPASGNQIDLSWHDMSDDEEGFSIHRSSDGVNFEPVKNLAPGTTAYCDAGLDSSTDYEHRVYAYKADQMSDVSNTTAAKTNPSPPMAPANLTATAAGSQINLAWTDNSDNETQFKIERSTDGSIFVLIGEVAEGSTTFQDKTALENIRYYYKVRSFNPGGTSYSNTANATVTPGPPAAPSGLTATAISTSTITLAWVDESTNETGHKIERSTNNQQWTQIATAAANVITYSSASLSPATTYYYRVRAYNNLGDSPYSNTASAATFGPPPQAPGNLRITNQAATEITIAWNDNSANEDGFHVEHSTDGATFLQIHAAAANATQYRHQNLEVKSQHYYRVRAFNSDGNSPYSNTVNGSTTGLPPETPTDLTATALSSTEIDLSWVDPAADEDGFEIERSTDGVTFSEITQTAANVASFQDASLSSSTTYYYRVRAFNGDGNSSYSNIANATTMLGPPNAPSNLTVVASSATEARLSWNDNANNEDSVEIERSADGTSFTKIADAVSNATSHTDNPLEPDTKYYYRIRAVNSAGASEYTAAISITTPEIPPDAPTGLQASAVSSSQLSLTWIDNSNNEDGFKIERSADGTTFTQITQTTAGAASFDDKSVASGQTYYYRVRAYNTGGNSAYTDVASASTPEAPPAAPSNLQAPSINLTEVQLRWTDNSSNEDGFNIEQSSDGVSFVNVQSVAANATTATVTNLAPQTGYSFRVRAYNSAGESDSSNVISVTTTQPAPAAPGNLAAQAISSTRIDLAWSDASGNETGFRIERSTNGTTFAQIASLGADVVSYSNTALQANTLYYYRVRAVNDGGVSPFSNTASATTLLNPPATPSSLAATAASSSQINLSWTDNSGNETGFKIERSSDGTSFTQIATVGSGVRTYSNTGLSSATRYYYRVRAYNSGGNSAYSNIANTTTKVAIPAAPGSLTATTISRTQINLAWADNSSNEQGFKIERSTDGVSFSQIATVGANVKTYSSTGLTRNRKYYYRVRSYNTGGNSAYSNVASATTLR